MSYTYTRRYTGPVRAVVLDWAGTAVDHGCLAPVGVFREVFSARGVAVTLDEARGPMGTHKRDHVARMCAMPGVRTRWIDAHGAPPTDADIDGMYAALGPLAIAALDAHADLVPGLLPAIAALRARGVRIGSTTGYNRAMLDRVVELAAARGYHPDSHVAASDVPAGRPAPYMAWEAVARLGVLEVQACVKVGDTVVDIEEGLNAGMWSIGVAASGNEVGLDVAALAALSPAERAARVGEARAKLARAGAHLVLDSVAELPEAVDRVERWLAEGRRP